MKIKRIVSGLTMLICFVMILAGCSGSSTNGTVTSGTPTNQMGGAKQGKPLTLTGTVSTLAGLPVFASSDGAGPLAQFSRPSGITTDSTNLYVADTANNSIRKVVIATGVVTTLAGSPVTSGSSDGTGAAARFYHPSGITSDGTSLYVADSGNQTIRKVVIATGAVTTLAGSAGTSGSTDGTGAAARFFSPLGITTDGTNLYVADSGSYTIRKVVIATGAVTTLAGNNGIKGSTDGTGTAAQFYWPAGITTDGTNLYVADSGSYTIRKVVIATGVVTTLAGAGVQGSTDGTGAVARFHSPHGITTDGTNLYVADTYNHTIRKVVIATGAVTTLAGNNGTRGSTDGTGAAAQFYWPEGITTDGTNLYVADTDNNTIRKMVIATGTVTTLAGSAVAQGSANGTGAVARFYYPSGITTDGTTLYVADTYNHTIRKIIIATGAVNTLAGSPVTSGSTDGTGAEARFYYPSGITTDGTNLYVADSGNHTIRKVVIATGEVTTLAGSPGAWGPSDGTGAAARFYSPSGITTDGTNLYVADSDNNTIRKVVIATGVVTTLAGSPYVWGSANDGTGAEARFYYPSGITTDGTNLYVADTSNSTIRKVVIATGAVTTLAGSPGVWGSANGTGGSALFYSPSGITTDGTNLYVVDTYKNTIRKVVIATGAVTTLAGSTGSNTEVQFHSPQGITTDGVKLYVANSANNTINNIQ